MKTKVFFLINDEQENKVYDLINRHLFQYDVCVGTNLPEDPKNYNLIILWNIRRILKELPTESKLIIFHSSDLPKGRGWAPIYHALAENRSEHVISAILAAPKVDSGDKIGRAHV